MDLTPQEGEAALGLQLPVVHYGEGLKVHANVRRLPALQAQGKAAAQHVGLTAAEAKAALGPRLYIARLY